MYDAFFQNLPSCRVHQKRYREFLRAGCDRPFIRWLKDQSEAPFMMLCIVAGSIYWMSK